MFGLFLVSLFSLFFTRSEYEVSLVELESTRVIKRNTLGQIVDLYCVEVEEEISWLIRKDLAASSPIITCEFSFYRSPQI